MCVVVLSRSDYILVTFDRDLWPWRLTLRAKIDSNVHVCVAVGHSLIFLSCCYCSAVLQRDTELSFLSCLVLYGGLDWLADRIGIQLTNIQQKLMIYLLLSLKLYEETL